MEYSFGCKPPSLYKIMNKFINKCYSFWIPIRKREDVVVSDCAQRKVIKNIGNQL